MIITFFLFILCVSFIIIFICIQAGTIDSWEREYEGQVNRTQQDYNLLGQRVVCQYIYILTLNNCMKWSTNWSVRWIKKEKRDKDGWTNEKQTWSSCSFILLLSESHLRPNKVIELKTERDIEAA